MVVCFMKSNCLKATSRANSKLRNAHPSKEPIVDINAIIKEAKLGQSRKDAQEDTCTVFAAALFDVLVASDVSCQMVCAVNKDGMHGWAHSVVEVDGRYYDSLGEFSTEIYRTRAKIYPSVSVAIEYRKDIRTDCYEPEFDEMYIFYAKALKKAMCGQISATAMVA